MIYYILKSSISGLICIFLMFVSTWKPRRTLEYSTSDQKRGVGNHGHIYILCTLSKLNCRPIAPMLIHWRTICSIMHFTTRAERFVLCCPLACKSCLVYYSVLTFYICDPVFLASHWTEVQRMNIVKRIPAHQDI